MADFFLPTDAEASFPVTFADQVGRPVAGPAGLEPTVSDATVLSAAFDGTTLTVKPLAAGSTKISFAGLTGELDVTVGAPAPTSVAFGTPTVGPLA